VSFLDVEQVVEGSLCVKGCDVLLSTLRSML
jgi:hypothetical protein